MPKIFGLEHILYFVIVIFLMTVILLFIKKRVKGEKQTLSIRITGVVLLVMIILNRLSICIEADNYRYFLPDSYCGTSSLVLSVSAIFFKRDSKIFHCIAYTGFLGGTLTLIYPDFIGQASSIFYSKTITGLNHHAVMVFLVILMFMTGFIKPELKKWYILPLGLSGYITYGVFLITILGYDDAMYIFNPVLEDTIFNWLGLGLIFIPVQVLFLLGWEKLKKA